VAWAEAYLHAKCHLDPSSHLSTTDKPKIGGLCPFLQGELSSHLAQCGLGRGLPTQSLLRLSYRWVKCGWYPALLPHILPIVTPTPRIPAGQHFAHNLLTLPSDGVWCPWEPKTRCGVKHICGAKLYENLAHIRRLSALTDNLHAQCTSIEK